MVGRASTRCNQVGGLPALLQDVNVARKQVGKERTVINAFHPQAFSARLTLHKALEVYAAALATAGWPLPYQLRDELFLYRRLARPGRPGPAE
jgi:hypothetical protein